VLRNNRSLSSSNNLSYSPLIWVEFNLWFLKITPIFVYQYNAHAVLLGSWSDHRSWILKWQANLGNKQSKSQELENIFWSWTWNYFGIIYWIKMMKLGQMIIIIGQSDCQDVGHRFGKLLRVKSKENSFKKLKWYTYPWWWMIRWAIFSWTAMDPKDLVDGIAIKQMTNLVLDPSWCIIN
jgi:hypothetical protein